METQNIDQSIWEKSWNKAFDMRYDCFFQELCSEWLVAVWKGVDSISIFLITMTASGSAISGWFLWEKPGFKELWTILAGLAALISIFHSAFDVSKRIEEGLLQYTQFKELRFLLEKFQLEMEIMKYDNIEQYKTHLLEITDRYGKVNNSIRPDFFLTKRRKTKIQKKLNLLLGYE